MAINNIKATSTNMDRRYILSAFLPTVQVKDKYALNQNPQIEIFSSTMVKACNLMDRQGYYQFTNEHVPVIARRRSGNTSCWWMWMTASGKNHPLLIKAGELLSIPIIDRVRQALIVQDNNVSRIPRFRTI